MLTSFNFLDYLILGVIVLSVLISLWRGFIREVFSFIIWVLAFIIAVIFSGPLANHFGWMIDNHALLLAISFVVLFLVTLIIGMLLNYLVAKLIDVTGLSLINRLLGAVFGFLRGVLMVTVVVFCLSGSNMKEQPFWQASQLMPVFQSLAMQLHAVFPDNIMATYSGKAMKAQVDKVKATIEEKSKAIESEH